MLNGAGCIPIVMIDVPVVAGWKVVFAEVAPAWKTTGLVTIVPTAVVELVTGTLIGATPGFSGKP